MFNIIIIIKFWSKYLLYDYDNDIITIKYNKKNFNTFFMI